MGLSAVDLDFSSTGRGRGGRREEEEEGKEGREGEDEEGREEEGRGEEGEGRGQQVVPPVTLRGGEEGGGGLEGLEGNGRSTWKRGARKTFE